MANKLASLSDGWKEKRRFVFPSPAGNRESHMLDCCEEIAKRAGLDEEKWNLKMFRST
jgi:hypothetical protein